MGPGNYHSVDALGYRSLDGIGRNGLEFCPFLSHHHPALRGGGGPFVPRPRGFTSQRFTVLSAGETL
jgi:hypothetical protein